MSDEKEPMTMSAEELNALVDARIRERDEQRVRAAERIREALNPTPPPAKPINAPDELVAELTKALDANGGDVDKASLQILGWLSVDIEGRPAYPNFHALFYGWEFMRDVLTLEARAGAVKNLMSNIKRQRERAKAGV